MAWLVWSFAAFVAAVSSQIVMLRFFRVRHAMVAFICGGIPIGLILIATLLLNWSVDRSIAGTLLYTFLCELWMFILSVIFSSVTVSLTMHLRAQPKTLEGINRLYDDRIMIQNRIGWLADIGAAVNHYNQLIPTRGGKKVAGLFNVFRSFFGHR